MATQTAGDDTQGWRKALPASLRPYTEAAPLGALFLGISSGFPYAMIGATLTTRLKQDGIDKSTITAFTLVFLAYNLKFLWAWVVDGVRLPLLGPARAAGVVDAGDGRAGHRGGMQSRAGAIPRADIGAVVTAAILVGIAGASFDIVIDAYPH